MAETLNTPSALSQPIAQSGDKNTIPLTNDQSLGLMSQSTGFPPICSQRIADGGKAPRRADFNGAFNLLSQQHFFLQNGGSYTFRQDVSDAIGGYPLNAMLFYVDSIGNVKIVRSMMPNNTFNFISNPSYIDDGVHWETVIPTKDWVIEMFVDLTGSQTISGDKNFTGALTKNGSDVITSEGGYVYKNLVFKDNKTALSPSETTWFASSIPFHDKNNARVAAIQPKLNNDGTVDLYILAEDPTNGLKSLVLNSGGYLTWLGNTVTIQGDGIPNYTRGVGMSGIPVNGTPYQFTAPYNCYVGISVLGTGVSCSILSSNQTLIDNSDVAPQAASVCGCSAYVKKGDTVIFRCFGTSVTANYFPLYGG